MAEQSDRGAANRPSSGPGSPPARGEGRMGGTTAEPTAQGQHQRAGSGPATTEQAREQARKLASEAGQQTSQLAGQAGRRVGTLMAEQKDRAAERLGGLAGVLRDAAAKLGADEPGGRMGEYARRAADRVESMSSYVRRSDTGTLFQDTSRLGRRRPEIFVGGTFLAGLLVGRFLKASSRGPGRFQAPAGER